MALEQQQQLTLDFDTTKDHHISKRPKLNEDDLLEDDNVQENNAVDAAVDFALQMLARDQRRVREPSITFSVAPHRDTVGLKSNQFVGQICASLKASELSNDANTRAPIDIVVALDVSGSMRVEKLDLCKNTLKLLLKELHHDDRFCLISFSDEAKVEIPMLKVDEDQKILAMHTIEHLSTRGRTNIASAISLAAQIANSVPQPNKVRSVFLLTDGQANVGPTDAKDLVELTGIFVNPNPNPNLATSPPISLHTFGYGPEPDQKLLLDMAKTTSGGSFYPVKDNSHVFSAFGDAVGGILSVVAHDVSLSISVPVEAARCGSEIIAVHHESKTEIANVIKRPNSQELAWPNREVAIHWLRVRTANCIAQAETLAKVGELDKAKKELEEWIEEFTRESFEIGATKEPLIEQLQSDLTESLDLLNEGAYNAYVENDLGVRVRTHMSQRCSEPFTGKRNVYRTGQKRFRAQAFHNKGN
eukprot:scaffold11171_cov139-Skeletonema_menzelii.AAC.2